MAFDDERPACDRVVQQAHVREFARVVDAIIVVLDRVHQQCIRVVVIAGLFLVALYFQIT